MTDEKTGGRSPQINLSDKDHGSSAAAFSSGPWLEDLLSRRLIFVMGKGGVGKTTISIALAVAAQRFNKKVLLAELGDTDAIGRLYAGQTLSETPRQLASGIWGARVDAKTELKAYVRAHLPSKFIARKIIRSQLFNYLFEAVPGLKEVMSLGRLWRWEKQDHHLSGTSFDLIIVDAPATGHALSLLRLPDLLIKMIRVGPLTKQLRIVGHLLKNSQKTAIALVTLPEELPVNETVELYSMANDSLDMTVAAIFINSVYPDFFDRHDMEHIRSLKKKFQNRFSRPENLLITGALNLIRRRGFQQEHMKTIYEIAKCHVQEIPFCFTNDMTLKEIEGLQF